MSVPPEDGQMTSADKVRRLIAEEINTQLGRVPTREDVEREIRERLDELRHAERGHMRDYVTGELSPVRSDIRQMKNTLNQMSGQVGEMSRDVSGLLGEMRGWRQFVDTNTEQLRNQREDIGKLDKKADALEALVIDVEQRSRLLNQEVYGNKDAGRDGLRTLMRSDMKGIEQRVSMQFDKLEDVRLFAQDEMERRQRAKENMDKIKTVINSMPVSEGIQRLIVILIGILISVAFGLETGVF